MRCPNVCLRLFFLFVILKLWKLKLETINTSSWIDAWKWNRTWHRVDESRLFYTNSLITELWMCWSHSALTTDNPASVYTAASRSSGFHWQLFKHISLSWANFFGNTTTVQYIQAVANAHNEGSACTDMQPGPWNLGNSCLAAETLRELVARWPFFFVFAGWLCNCRKERRRGICWLLSIHFPSLPQGAAVCFWSLWKWVQAAPRMCWLVATGLVLHFRVRHGQTGFPQSVYTDKLLRHVCHVKECPSVSDAHRQCVHREGLLCCFSALHNSLHVFDR